MKSCVLSDICNGVKNISDDHFVHCHSSILDTKYISKQTTDCNTKATGHITNALQQKWRYLILQNYIWMQFQSRPQNAAATKHIYSISTAVLVSKSAFIDIILRLQKQYGQHMEFIIKIIKIYWANTTTEKISTALQKGSVLCSWQVQGRVVWRR